MTLKQQVHDLVEDLPEDSPLLMEVREALRLNRAIGEAMDDMSEGRTYSAAWRSASPFVLRAISIEGAAPKRL